jgi:signal transduction histidine kinase
MKIKAKITLFTSFFLALMVVVITYFSVRNIEQQGELQLQAYQNEEIEDIKAHLKDLVNVAYETIDKNYRNLSDVAYLSKYYQKRLQNILDSGETIIQRYQRRVEDGELSLSEAQRRARAEIRELRFDGGTGYIWINDTSEPYPKMVMHPTIPALEGQVLDSPEYNNALGRRMNLFRAFVDVTRNSREGYVDYLWPKPTEQGLTEEVPKLSYVRRYDDWGWILGTGIYIDDSRAEIEQQIKQAIKSMRYANGTGYFWINDNTLPFPTMVMHPTIPDLDGQVMDDPKYNNALGVDKNLFQAFAEITAQKGDGFIDYLWPKPTAEGLTERTGKVSYVKLHEPTGWIIGTGVYLDKIDAAILNKKRQIAEQINETISSNIMVSVVFIGLALVISFVFSNTLAGPISRLTEIAQQISKGKNLDATIDGIGRSDEIGELAKSIDRLKTSIKIMMDRMSK